MGSNFFRSHSSPSTASQSVAPLSRHYSLQEQWNSPCSSGVNRVGDPNTPWQAFKSKLIFRLHWVTSGFLHVCSGNFGLISLNSWAQTLNSKHSSSLAGCSIEVKEGPLIWTKPTKVKSTQNYSVHPARTEKCSHAFQRRWKETVRGIISVAKELITASILGTTPLWVTEPRVCASPRLTVNSSIPVNHTEHLFMRFSWEPGPKKSEKVIKKNMTSK